MSEKDRSYNLDLSPFRRYASLERQRLSGSELRDSEFYEIWMRLRENKKWVFQGVVKLEQLVRTTGDIACQTVLLDPDMQPALELPSTVQNDYWLPGGEIKLMKKGVEGNPDVGFFRPYTNSLNDEFLWLGQELQVPVAV